MSKSIPKETPGLCTKNFFFLTLNAGFKIQTMLIERMCGVYWFKIIQRFNMKMHIRKKNRQENQQKRNDVVEA